MLLGGWATAIITSGRSALARRLRGARTAVKERAQLCARNSRQGRLVCGGSKDAARALELEAQALRRTHTRRTPRRRFALQSRVTGRTLGDTIRPAASGWPTCDRASEHGEQEYYISRRVRGDG